MREMKYISAFVFLAAMYWSWGLVHRNQPISEEVHVSLQNEVKRFITEYIQSQLPNSRNLRFERFWTETMDKNKVKAIFTYSYDDANDEVGETRTQIEGYVILHKNSEDVNNIDWTKEEPVILNNTIDYRDPLRVSPKETAPSGG
jgi:hypothetical protein